MADVIIDLIAPDDLSEVVSLYNQIFRPARGKDEFERRYLGRHNIVQMVARLNHRPVGFVLGFELKPRVFYVWFVGVVPARRRQGLDSEVIVADHRWVYQ